MRSNPFPAVPSGPAAAVTSGGPGGSVPSEATLPGLHPRLEELAREGLAACDGVLARIWLEGPGDACPTCPMRPECADRSRCLHLVASAGATTRTDGPYRRFPIGARRVGRVVVERAPFVADAGLETSGLADPAWLAAHRVKTFIAVPLAEGVGVLALFSRRALGDGERRLLALAARFAAPPEAPVPVTPAAAAGPRPLAEVEREAIEHALVHAGGRVSGPRGAAALLGLKPSTLDSRIKKLGVRRPRG